MTRHIRDLASRLKTGKTALLQPVPVARNLTTDVVERISAQIETGALQPGDRLPTEQELMLGLGVSRTVIREAMAALKSDGLITTRQGSGAFVSDDPTRRPFRLWTQSADALGDIHEVLELRLAVEVEAARIAARRASAAALKKIGRAQNAFDAAVARGELAATEDFDLHRSIAEATGNRQFQHFLGFLGAFIIPRLSLTRQKRTLPVDAGYLDRLCVEHAAICDAIRAHDETASARAMREHLQKSLQRYAKP
jgi:GntR family transcriptional regulator, transcriptional repressor for pyruvate dehydrogenase complex